MSRKDGYAKCLSVRQPYAWAIMAGLKRFENRDWFCNYRGPLLIHASSAKPKSLLLPDGSEAPADLDLGAIVGVVEMTGCITYLQGGILSEDPFALGRYCFVLEFPTNFDRPLPYKGQTGLFDVPLSALD